MTLKQNRSRTVSRAARLWPGQGPPSSVPAWRGRHRTHDALGVKEHLHCLARRSDRPAFCSPRSDDILIHMSLGNGYLGSRIDEERSKMRYLVSIA